MQETKPIITVAANIYVCAICHSVNHANRLSCSTCGTIPAEYSIIGKPTVLHDPEDSLGARFVEVVNAHGCMRIEYSRQARAYFRTVPLDYYAES